MDAHGPQEVTAAECLRVQAIQARVYLSAKWSLYQQGCWASRLRPSLSRDTAANKQTFHTCVYLAPLLTPPTPPLRSLPQPTTPPPTVFAALFLAVSVYNRLDFTITRDERWQEERAKDKARGILQQLLGVWERECVCVLLCVHVRGVHTSGHPADATTCYAPSMNLLPHSFPLLLTLSFRTPHSHTFLTHIR